mgnify:CR=1 FL=1
MYCVGLGLSLRGGFKILPGLVTFLKYSISEVGNMDIPNLSPEYDQLLTLQFGTT